eukprot:756815-Hanusia_phi.AAC.1
MSSRAKSKYHEDQEVQLREHTVPSWTIEEYLQAAEHAELYRLVEPYLDIDPSAAYLDGKDTDKLTEKEEKIRCKYYVAGGSCRYMFEMKGDEVKKELHAALAKASDISGIFMGNVGTSSPEIVNRLIAVFLLKSLSEDFEMTRTMPVSRYAARQLAMRAEVSVLKQLIHKQGLRHSTNERASFRGAAHQRAE